MLHRVLVLVLLATACSAPPRAPADTHLHAAPLSHCRPDAAPNLHITFRGGLHLTWPGWRAFGGWSDLRVMADDQWLAISDDGHWLRGTLAVKAGQLIGATGEQTGALHGCPAKARCDAESLTLRPDGSTWIGLESQPLAHSRILAFAKDDPLFERAPADVALAPGMESMPHNAGLEAMATLADGSLLAIEEGSEPLPLQLRAWLWQNNTWRTLQFSTSPNWRPVSLAALPKDHPLGDALVLERLWLGKQQLAGTRVRALRLPASGDEMMLRDVMELSTPGCLVDNFEGLAVQERGGALWLWLLSDDNLRTEQKTLLFAFALE